MIEYRVQDMLLLLNKSKKKNVTITKLIPSTSIIFVNLNESH